MLLWTGAWMNLCIIASVRLSMGQWAFYLEKVDNIHKIPLGFKGSTRIIVPDKPKHESPHNLLFNYEYDINKHLLSNCSLKFELPADTMHLPTYCFNCSDKDVLIILC